VDVQGGRHARRGLVEDGTEAVPGRELRVLEVEIGHVGLDLEQVEHVDARLPVRGRIRPQPLGQGQGRAAQEAAPVHDRALAPPVGFGQPVQELPLLRGEHRLRI
jgi:hypothetical protein